MSEYAALIHDCRARGRHELEPYTAARWFEAAAAIEALGRDVETLSELNVDWSQQVVGLINRAEKAERERDAVWADVAAFRAALNACHGTDMGGYYRVEPVEAWEYVAALTRTESPGAALLDRMAQLEAVSVGMVASLSGAATLNAGHEGYTV